MNIEKLLVITNGSGDTENRPARMFHLEGVDARAGLGVLCRVECGVRPNTGIRVIGVRGPMVSFNHLVGPFEKRTIFVLVAQKAARSISPSWFRSKSASL